MTMLRDAKPLSSRETKKNSSSRYAKKLGLGPLVLQKDGRTDFLALNRWSYFIEIEQSVIGFPAFIL